MGCWKMIEIYNKQPTHSVVDARDISEMSGRRDGLSPDDPDGVDVWTIAAVVDCSSYLWKISLHLLFSPLHEMNTRIIRNSVQVKWSTEKLTFLKNCWYSVSIL